MKEKEKHSIRRWISGYLVLVMMLTFLFDHPFVSLSYANLSGETGGAAASASDAIRNGKVSLKNQPKQDIQITVVSDQAGYDAGDMVCLDLYITNHTDQEITEGLLKYRGRGILEDSAYFEDLSDLYQAGTKENGEEKENPAEPVSQEENETDLEEDEEWETASDSDADREEYPDRLTDLTIAPGQSYFVNFYFTIDDEISGIKNQNIEFTFRGMLEDKTVTAKETFRYGIGAMNLLPVEVGREGQAAYGETSEMLLDFDLGDLEDMILEAELEAMAEDEEADSYQTKKASSSQAKKASSSQAKKASSSQAKTASSSQLKPDSSSKPWIKWEGDLTGIPKTAGERPLVKNLKCQVEVYGIKLKNFRLADQEEEDEYGTSVVCQFTVGPDAEPGVYQGKVTAAYQFKNRKFQSTQGFFLTVTEPEDELVAEIIALIEELPELEEAASILEGFDQAGDDQGYEKYLTELSVQVRHVYVMYESLEEERRELVTNRDKLLQYEWLWSAMPMAVTNTVNVTAVNSFSWSSYGGALIVHGDNGLAVRDSGMGEIDFLYWYAVRVEKENGIFVVKQVETGSGTSKRDVWASGDGFILLFHTGVLGTDVTVNVGDMATVSSDFWRSYHSYNGQVYGTVTFSSPAAQKNPKDNSGQLTVIEAASTREFIELNLYDYGSGSTGRNINDKFNSDSNMPGFQQSGGTSDIGSLEAFRGINDMNFGDIVTSDLADGTLVTNQRPVGINVVKDSANSPISRYDDVMSKELKNGYPALKNGTSLGYLFGVEPYSKKMNGQSVDGLFQYDEETGAYSFNSRTNFAQFDSSDDTFTLYDEIFTPNFIMYPFGNFMPFNDIVHDSKQVSQINEGYFKELMLQASYLYQQGQGSQYAQLAKVLGQFLQYAKEDNWGNGWTAERALQHYFYWGSELPGPDDNDHNFNQISLDRLYSLDYDVASDFYFGMEMKMNFMQPKGGLTGKDGKQPMEFYFTGDDDVWVYLDGRLFLDLSGIHRHVGGEIDFVKGEVRYYSLDTKTGDVSNVPYQTVPFRDLVADQSMLNDQGTFKDYTTHSFNFYYMERGSGSSVCRLNFNFPLLRQNSVSVKKELSVDEADKLSLLGNPDFRFQVLKESGTQLFIGGNTEYDIYNESNEKIGTGRTDANGVFVLKANQTAVFSDISEDSGRYFVRELLNPADFEQYGTITVDGSSTTTDYDVVIGEDSFKGVNSPVKDVSDGSTVFSFNNQVIFKKLGSLEITKKLHAYETISPEPRFRFRVDLDGQPLPVGTVYKVRKNSETETGPEGEAVSQAEEERTVSEAGIITLTAEETARIPNMLAGSRFTVTEQQSSAEGYQVSYQVDQEEPTGEMAAGVIQTGSLVSVIVTNTQKGGASIDLPVTKLLEQTDGTEHTYRFTLEQVTGADHELPVENGTRQTIEVTVGPVSPEVPPGTESSTNTGNFTLTYLERDITGSQETYYYQIWEELEETPGVLTKFDDSRYLAEITVEKTGDGLQISVTKYKKSSEAGKSWVEIPDPISFTNRLLQGYELPETGGMGTRWYTFSGIAWMALALMYDILRRKGKL